MVEKSSQIRYRLGLEKVGTFLRGNYFFCDLLSTKYITCACVDLCLNEWQAGRPSVNSEVSIGIEGKETASSTASRLMRFAS